MRRAAQRAIAGRGRRVRIPVRQAELIGKMVRVADRLRAELGRQPDEDEIALEMGLDKERVTWLFQVAQEPVSLETPVGEDGDSQLGQFIEDRGTPGPDEEAARTLMRDQVEDVLDTLPARARRGVQLRL